MILECTRWDSSTNKACSANTYNGCISAHVTGSRVNIYIYIYIYIVYTRATYHASRGRLSGFYMYTYVHTLTSRLPMWLTLKSNHRRPAYPKHTYTQIKKVFFSPKAHENTQQRHTKQVYLQAECLIWAKLVVTASTKTPDGTQNAVASVSRHINADFLRSNIRTESGQPILTGARVWIFRDFQARSMINATTNATQKSRVDEPYAEETEEYEYGDVAMLCATIRTSVDIKSQLGGNESEISVTGLTGLGNAESGQHVYVVRLNGSLVTAGDPSIDGMYAVGAIFTSHDFSAGLQNITNGTSHSVPAYAYYSGPESGRLTLWVRGRSFISGDSGDVATYIQKGVDHAFCVRLETSSADKYARMCRNIMLTVNHAGAVYSTPQTQICEQRSVSETEFLELNAGAEASLLANKTEAQAADPWVCSRKLRVQSDGYCCSCCASSCLTIQGTTTNFRGSLHIENKKLRFPRYVVHDIKHFWAPLIAGNETFNHSSSSNNNVSGSSNITATPWPDTNAPSSTGTTLKFFRNTVVKFSYISLKTVRNVSINGHAWDAANDFHSWFDLGERFLIQQPQEPAPEHPFVYVNSSQNDKLQWIIQIMPTLDDPHMAVLYFETRQDRSLSNASSSNKSPGFYEVNFTLTVAFDAEPSSSYGCCVEHASYAVGPVHVKGVGKCQGLTDCTEDEQDVGFAPINSSAALTIEPGACSQSFDNIMSPLSTRERTDESSAYSWTCGFPKRSMPAFCMFGKRWVTQGEFSPQLQQIRCTAPDMVLEYGKVWLTVDLDIAFGHGAFTESKRLFTFYDENHRPVISVNETRYYALAGQDTQIALYVTVSDPELSLPVYSDYEMRLSIHVSEGVAWLGNSSLRRQNIDVNANLTDLRSLLSEGVMYTPPADFTGFVDVSMTVYDQGVAGLGGVLQDTIQLGVVVVAMNPNPKFVIDGGVTDLRGSGQGETITLYEYSGGHTSGVNLVDEHSVLVHSRPHQVRSMSMLLLPLCSLDADQSACS
jgi:hypothetical protein